MAAKCSVTYLRLDQLILKVSVYPVQYESDRNAYKTSLCFKNCPRRCTPQLVAGYCHLGSLCCKRQRNILFVEILALGNPLSSMSPDLHFRSGVHTDFHTDFHTGFHTGFHICFHTK